MNVLAHSCGCSLFLLSENYRLMKGGDGMSSHGKKIKWNLLSVIACQIITIGIGFLLPRLYIENFGSAVNGVLSTIKQIFTYLCLLEAGIGLASSQALLRPVATADRDSINAILAATRQYYIRTGIVYSVAVTGIAVVYGFFVDTGLSAMTVAALVLLNGIPSMITFFIQGKYQILLETDGRQYILTNSQIALQVLSGFGKIAVLLLTDSLVLMQATYCLFAVLQLLFVTVYARRQYRWLNFRVRPDKGAIAQKNAVLLHQISAMVFNNTDILLLSFISGFEAVSVYTIYHLFFTQVETFIAALVKGFNFALGQLFSVDRKTFAEKYETYEMGYIAANFIVYTLMCVFLLPIVQIYTKGVTDADYYMPTAVLLFAVAKLLSAARMPANQVIEYAGGFKDTRWHAVTEMAINLTVSVVCIFKWGICGALIGTIVAILFRSIAVVLYTNRRVLHRSPLKTFALWGINGGVFLLIYAVFRADHFAGMRFLPLVGSGLLHMLWIVPLYMLANAAFRPQQAKRLFTALKVRMRKHEHA